MHIIAIPKREVRTGQKEYLKKNGQEFSKINGRYQKQIQDAQREPSSINTNTHTHTRMHASPLNTICKLLKKKDKFKILKATRKKKRKLNMKIYFSSEISKPEDNERYL